MGCAPSYNNIINNDAKKRYLTFWQLLCKEDMKMLGQNYGKK